ncbi:MAG: hypothetical protein R3C26_12270 [Calditrichia bacterium]
MVLFYIAWRAFSHYKSQKGGQKALSEMPLKFVPGSSGK